MRLENSGGDVLARGGSRANFTQGSKVDQKKWDDIFADYIPDSEKQTNEDQQNSVPALAQQ